MFGFLDGLWGGGGFRIVVTRKRFSLDVILTYEAHRC